jgi:hypothetical protein
MRGLSELRAVHLTILRGIRDALMDQRGNLATLVPAQHLNLQRVLCPSSIHVGLLTAVLYDAGFPESDRLSAIHGQVSRGEPVCASDLDWLDATVRRHSWNFGDDSAIQI